MNFLALFWNNRNFYLAVLLRLLRSLSYPTVTADRCLLQWRHYRWNFPLNRVSSPSLIFRKAHELEWSILVLQGLLSKDHLDLNSKLRAFSINLYLTELNIIFNNNYSWILPINRRVICSLEHSFICLWGSGFTAIQNWLRLWKYQINFG